MHRASAGPLTHAQSFHWSHVHEQSFCWSQRPYKEFRHHPVDAFFVTRLLLRHILGDHIGKILIDLNMLYLKLKQELGLSICNSLWMWTIWQNILTS